MHSNRGTALALVALGLGIGTASWPTADAHAQGTHRAGDRVECEVTGGNRFWEAGTVMPFRPNDGPDGSWYRVKADSNQVEYYCRLEHIRPIAGAPAAPASNANPAGPASRAPDTPAPSPTAALATAGQFLQCPVPQPGATNGSRPDPELLKLIIRCAKGEKAVAPGDEGAVKVDVASVQVGASRPWSYRQDQGSGQTDTIVFPVKATYTVSTYYRTATEIEEGWIRVLNFYVDAFGEWRIGSEEPVRVGAARRVP